MTEVAMMRHLLMQKQGKRSAGVRLIAFGKLIQVLLVLIVGASALLFVDQVAPESLKAWVDTFAPQSEWLNDIANKLVSATDKKLSVIGIVSLAYAVLFSVEGIGLMRQRTWAEYLTVIVTSSFMPFEIYGLTREFSWAKLTTIAINSAVVGFLTLRIVRDRRASRGAEASRQSGAPS